MQGQILVFLLLAVALTQGLFFDSKLFICLFIDLSYYELIYLANKCPIKQYKSSKYITGYKLLVHNDFVARVKSVESAAKNCKVAVYITDSYYQLSDPTLQVLVSQADLVIGHAFQFELRDLNNAILCNSLCLSKSRINFYKIFSSVFVCLDPTAIPEVKCLLQSAQQSGLKWSIYNSNTLSDGTYASNPTAWQSLKTNIQTQCKNQSFKRELLQLLRRTYDEEEDSDEETTDEEEKKK